MGQCISGGSAAARRADSFTISDSSQLPNSGSDSSIHSICSTTTGPDDRELGSGKTKYRKVRKYQPILIKSGPRNEDSSRRAKFFVLSKSDMKKSDKKSKKVAAPVKFPESSSSTTTTPLLPPPEVVPRSSPSSLKKKHSKKFVSKSVTFSEPERPEIENKDKPSRLRSRRRHRKPLISVNVIQEESQQQEDTTTTSDVSKVPIYFQFSNKNDENKNTTTTTTDTNLTDKLTLLSEDVTNGSDSSKKDIGVKKRTIFNTMGIYFRDSTGSGRSTTRTGTTTSLKYYSSEQLLLAQQHGGSNYDSNGAKNKIIQQSVNSESLTSNNNNFNNTTTAATEADTTNKNINYNNNTNVHSSSDDDEHVVKSAEIIREENRQRRNLFFSGGYFPEPLPPVNLSGGGEEQQQQYSPSSGNVNMINGYNNTTTNNKNSVFGFLNNHRNNSNEMKSKLHSSDQPTLNRQQQQITVAAEATGIPKLYSVNNSNLMPQHHQQQSQLYGKSLRGSQSTSSVPHLQPSSKLPTFASGSNIKSTSSMINKPNNAQDLNHRSIQHNFMMMKQPTTTAVNHQIDLSKKDDSKVSQWISANDFFKQQTSPPPPIINKLPVSNQHAVEPRRETPPSKFGFGYNNNNNNGQQHAPQLLATRKNFLHSQPPAQVVTTTNDEIRRGSLMNPVRKIPTYNFGLKKPIESKPFYEQCLYQNRTTTRNTIPPSLTTNNKNVEATTLAAAVGGFHGVSTGLVKQAASNYQKIIDGATPASVASPAKVSESTPNPHSPLIRSTTWIISSSDEPPNEQNTTATIHDPVVVVMQEGDKKDKPTGSSINIDTKVQKSFQPGMHWQPTITTRTSSPSSLKHHQSFQSSSSSSSSGGKVFRRNLSELHHHYRGDGDSGQRADREAVDDTRKANLALQHEVEGSTLCNYPIIRDESTSSSIISSEEPSSLHSHAPTDHDKAISDSEFLIDDEISDQPELTLTFKDSSLILSSSSSGESLVSCDLMLDYKDSNCGLLSSDSALLDETSLVSPRSRSSMTTSIVASEVLSTSSGVPQKIMVNSSANSSCRRSLGGGSQLGGGNSTPLTSSNKTPSNKVSYVSHRDRVLSNQLQNQQQNQNNCNSRQVHSNQSNQIINNSVHKSGKFISSIPSPIHDNSKALGLENHLNVSNTTKLRGPTITSKSPLRNNLVGRQIPPPPRTPSPIVPKSPGLRRSSRGRGREEVGSGSHRQQQQQQQLQQKSVESDIVQNSELEESELVSSLSDNFVKEILTEVLEYRNQLEELKSVLETTEKELVDKDAIISRQQKEIEYWKNTALEKKSNSEDDKEMISIIVREDSGDYWQKEKEITSAKETRNTAVQTESNYTAKPAVIYPDENDKMGQLVSFRIGRKSSSSNQS